MFGVLNWQRAYDYDHIDRHGHEAGIPPDITKHVSE